MILSCFMILESKYVCDRYDSLIIKEQMSSPVSGSRSGFHSAVSLDLRTFTGLLSFGQICWLDRDRFGSCWGAHGLCTSASPTGCSYWCPVCPLPLQVSATSQTQVVLVLSGHSGGHLLDSSVACKGLGSLLKVPVNGNNSVTGRWVNMKLIWALR